MFARNRLNSFLIIEFDFILTVDEGGVCAKFHEVQQTNETKEKEWRSHNTGVVNFAYNNNELPSQVVKLAFMHEIGHSLGSPVSNPPPFSVHQQQRISRARNSHLNFLLLKFLI